MQTPAWERWIERSAARIRFGQFLGGAANWCAPFLFAFGTVVLIVKLFMPQWWPHVLWLVTGTLPCLGLAWWLPRRNPWSRSQTVARLDQTLNSGGLLMTLCECPDAVWSERLPQVEALWKQAVPRLLPVRFVRCLILPLLFALGAGFVPLREASTAPVMHHAVAQKAAEELQDLVTGLDEQAILETDEEQELKEEVARLAEESRDTPLTHEKWETIDALKERMKVRLDAATMTATEAHDAATMLADAARSEALGDPPGLRAEHKERLEQKLGESMQELAQKGRLAGAPKKLQADLQRLSKNGKQQLPADANERKEFLDELRNYLDQESKKLTDLRKKCSTCTSGDLQGDGADDNDVEGSQTKFGTGGKFGSRPGQGGTTRGRGDAPLTWGNESDKQGTKFKETVLPPGFLDQPKEEIVRIGRTAPEEEAAASAPRSTQRIIDATAGNTAWRRKLNPKHRAVVRKYFEK